MVAKKLQGAVDHTAELPKPWELSPGLPFGLFAVPGSPPHLWKHLTARSAPGVCGFFNCCLRLVAKGSQSVNGPVSHSRVVESREPDWQSSGF